VKYHFVSFTHLLECCKVWGKVGEFPIAEERFSGFLRLNPSHLYLLL